jgi:acid stress-induced BolA-like protein IbaG/YrbA
MSGSHGSHDPAAVRAAVHEHIIRAIPDATVRVEGGGGHYSIEVVSPVFAGKGMLDSQRLVYAAIAPLLKGDDAPVHAVDSLRTPHPLTPVAPTAEKRRGAVAPASRTVQRSKCLEALHGGSRGPGGVR